MTGPRVGRLVLVAAVALAVGVAGAPSLLGESPDRASDVDIPSADGSVGQRVFFHETYGGNGRTCGTCHLPEDEFALSPEAVRAIHDRDPNDPLFRAIDSDDGGGSDYTTLLGHALIRVEVPLASNVSIVDHPAQRSNDVRRAVPSIVNVALTAPYQQDGRSSTLTDQALAAVRNHFEAQRRPTPRELAALARFESEIFEPQRLKVGQGIPTSVLPVPGFSIPLSSPVAIQGREVLVRNCQRCNGCETGSVVGS